MTRSTIAGHELDPEACRVACVAGCQRSLNGDVRLDLVGAVASVTGREA